MTDNESTEARPRMTEDSDPETETSSVEADSQFSAHVRWAQRGYVLVAGVVIIWVAIQVFIAGMAVFVNPARWDLHAIFGHLLIWPFLFMVVLSLVGRLPRALTWLPIGLLVLLFGQSVTAAWFGYGSLVAALHPVNALAIFWLTVITFRRAWQSVSGDQV